MTIIMMHLSGIIGGIIGATRIHPSANLVSVHRNKWLTAHTGIHNKGSGTSMLLIPLGLPEVCRKPLARHA